MQHKTHTFGRHRQLQQKCCTNMLATNDRYETSGGSHKSAQTERKASLRHGLQKRRPPANYPDTSEHDALNNAAIHSNHPDQSTAATPKSTSIRPTALRPPVVRHLAGLRASWTRLARRIAHRFALGPGVLLHAAPTGDAVLAHPGHQASHGAALSLHSKLLVDPGQDLLRATSLDLFAQFSLLSLGSLFLCLPFRMHRGRWRRRSPLRTTVPRSRHRSTPRQQAN